MDISNIIPHIEALIFASEKPLTALELTELTNNAFGFMDDKINLDQVESAIEGIIEKYAASFYPFEMKESGGGWQFLTKKDYHKTVAQLNGEKFLKRLSAASLETLAIVAYKQPITKGEVESIRGVNSDYSIQKLLEKELIIITGRNEELPGKPLVYATSKSFMDYFGINSPEELPKIKEVFTDQGIEATVVYGKEEEGEQENRVNAFVEQEVPKDEDVLLVVRGNGELIEEPQVVVDDETEPVDPEIFEGSEINEELAEEEIVSFENEEPTGMISKDSHPDYTEFQQDEEHLPTAENEKKAHEDRDDADHNISNSGDIIEDEREEEKEDKKKEE